MLRGLGGRRELTEVVPLNGVSRDEGGYFRTVESITYCQGEMGSQPMERDGVAGDKGRRAQGAEETSEDGSETDRQGAEGSWQWHKEVQREGGSLRSLREDGCHLRRVRMDQQNGQVVKGFGISASGISTRDSKWSAEQPWGTK